MRHLKRERKIGTKNRRKHDTHSGAVDLTLRGGDCFYVCACLEE